MCNKQRADLRNDKGIAIVTTLLLTLLLSILVGALLSSSTSDVLITGNDVRTNQAFYIAEAGIHRAAGWFTAKFGTDPNTGHFILPEQNPSNNAGFTGKLSYTDPPYYQKGAAATTFEQQVASSVKVLSGGVLKNVVLSGDSANTYPTSYTVSANNSAGAVTTFNYSEVVSDFTSNLSNQTEGEGKFSVKATLVSIIPPNGAQLGTATWLLESDGTITRGTNTTIASSTMYAYMSARLSPIQKTVTVDAGNQVVAESPGGIARGGINWNENQIRLDSYKSSKGGYNVALAANSFTGQIGAKNMGSRGDMRTNDEIIFPSTVIGIINLKNGTVTGSAGATNAKPAAGDPGPDPITIDTSKVDDGQGSSFSTSNEHYGQPPLTFPAVANPTAPPGGAVNYSYSSKNSATLPPNANGYNNIDISKGTLTIPPGNYGTLSVTTQGTVVLGVQGQSTVYNLQSFSAGAQAAVIFKGPVIINVKSGLTDWAGSTIADPSVPASAIRWNVVGGNVDLGGHGMTLGVFYAPNSPLNMQGGTDFYGAIVSQSVSLGGNAGIHIDEDAVSGASYNQELFSTTTSIVGYTATNYSLWRITQALN